MRPVELTWAGGRDAFALPIGQLRALQKRCDAGPAHILLRLTNGTWIVDDVFQTIRFGLEGGGMDASDALAVVERFVEPDHLGNYTGVAANILLYSLYGDGEADDPVGESEAGAETDQLNSRAAKSAGQSFTE